MSTIKSFIDFWNDRVKRMTIWELKLAQTWAALWMLLLVKIFPQLTSLSLWWYIAFIVILAPYLFYVLFHPKST